MSLLQAARSGDLAGLQAALRTGAKLEETNFDSCVCVQVPQLLCLTD